MTVLLLAACGHEVPMPASPTFDPARRWEEVLRHAVTRDGLLDYDIVRAERPALEAFVGWIGEHGPESDAFGLTQDDRRLAWHLNAYNALVIYGVLLAEPIRSVRDVPAPLGPPGTGFFYWWRFRVDRERTNLSRYEKAVILAGFADPRAHAALNCASRSCPPLRNELYRWKDLDSQLKDQMTRWVNGGAVTREPGGFVYNAIFDWYADDFRDYAGATSPCAAVRPYAEGSLARTLDALPGCPHRFAEYDWSLNQGER